MMRGTVCHAGVSTFCHDTASFIILRLFVPLPFNRSTLTCFFPSKEEDPGPCRRVGPNIAQCPSGAVYFSLCTSEFTTRQPHEKKRKKEKTEAIRLVLCIVATSFAGMTSQPAEEASCYRPTGLPGMEQVLEVLSRPSGTATQLKVQAKLNLTCTKLCRRSRLAGRPPLSDSPHNMGW